VVADSVVFHLKTNPVDLKRQAQFARTSPWRKRSGTNDALEREGLIKIERAAGDDVSLYRIIYREMDGALVMKDVGFYYMQRLKEEDRQKITFSPRPLGRLPLYLVVSRQIPGGEELVTLFNKGLMKLKQSGRLEQILVEFLFWGGYSVCRSEKDGASPTGAPPCPLPRIHYAKCYYQGAVQQRKTYFPLSSLVDVFNRSKVVPKQRNYVQ
jgi:hypothetical protein